MGAFWQVLGGVLIALVLTLVLHQQGKDLSLILSIAVCCMVIMAAAAYLEPVVAFVRQLQAVAKLDSEMMRIMLKAVGIGLIAEIASLICTDAGNGALGKAVQLLAAAVILWLALPMMQALLAMVQQMVGDV